MLVLDFSRCTHTTQIIAILALALVAGFSVNPSISCPDAVPLFGLNISYSIKYPFTTISNSSVPFSGGDVTTGSVSQTDKGITQGAQFFVAWGSLSLIYAIVALIVYIFVTANEKLEKAVDFLVWTVSLVVAALIGCREPWCFSSCVYCRVGIKTSHTLVLFSTF